MQYFAFLQQAHSLGVVGVYRAVGMRFVGALLFEPGMGAWLPVLVISMRRCLRLQVISVKARSLAFGARQVVIGAAG